MSELTVRLGQFAHAGAHLDARAELSGSGFSEARAAELRRHLWRGCERCWAGLEACPRPEPPAVEPVDPLAWALEGWMSLRDGGPGALAGFHAPFRYWLGRLTEDRSVFPRVWLEAGLELARKRAPTEAVALLEPMGELVRDEGGTRGLGNLAAAYLAEAHQLTGDFVRAGALFSTARRGLERQDWEVQAIVYELRAEFLAEAESGAGPVAWAAELARAERASRRCVVPGRRAENCCRAGRLWYLAGHHDLAFDSFTEALSHLAGVEDPRLRLDILHRQAATTLACGKAQLALERVEAAAGLMAAWGSDLLKTQADYCRGVALFQLGRWEEAEQPLLSALEGYARFCREVGEVFAEGALLTLARLMCLYLGRGRILEELWERYKWLYQTPTGVRRLRRQIRAAAELGTKLGVELPGLEALLDRFAPPEPRVN